MNQLLSCWRGHQWSAADASTIADADRCPVCGAPGQAGSATIAQTPAPADPFEQATRRDPDLKADNASPRRAPTAADLAADDVSHVTVDLVPGAAEAEPDAATRRAEPARPSDSQAETRWAGPSDGESCNEEISRSDLDVSGEDVEVSGEDVFVSREDVLASREDVAATGDFTHPADSDAGATADFRPLPPAARPRRRPPTRRQQPAPTPVRGYEILGELGRGGMGVVYKARQAGLNRVVALKMVLGGGHASPTDLARFRAEAEAVAQLQHPNIVQVYEVGEQDRCPYFSLEFVDGGSLESKVKGTPQPPQWAAQTVRALAQAMDYAHGRGILHRDLKPANVLLAAEGTPKITDFGLAKRLEGDSGQTRSGSVMGTPSYMAPEQAAGKTKEAGPAADVYSLGAVLYELLTGRPPFRGESVLETMRMVTATEPVPPSRLNSKVPHDLETVCLKCLEKDPKKRYATAADLADDLRRFLAREPVRARPTPAWERAAKWARRHPAPAGLISVSALTVLGLIVGGFAFARYEAQRANAERGLREQADASRAEAERERQRAEEQSAEAARQRGLAELHFRQAEAAVDQMLTRVGGEKLAHEPRMEKVRRDLLQKALAFYQELLKSQGPNGGLAAETARAYERVGDIQEMLGQYADAEGAYRSAAGMYRDLATKPKTAGDGRRGLASVTFKLAPVLHAAGRGDEAERSHAEALGLLTKLVGDFPSEPAYRRDLASALNNRAVFLQTHGRAADAERAYAQAQDVLAGLTTERPGDGDYQQEYARTLVNRGTLLQTQGRTAEAESAYHSALDIERRLVAGDPDAEDRRRELARTCVNLAVLCQQARRFEEAEAANREALDAFSVLSEQFPSVPDHRHQLAICCSNLADLLLARGKASDAEPLLTRSRDLLSRLAADLPTVPEYRRQLALTLNHLAALQVATKRTTPAERAWQQAVALQRQLVAEQPREPAYRLELARSLGNLGVLYARLNRLSQSEEQYRQADAVLADIGAGDPSAFRADRIVHRTNLARLLTALERRADAHDAWLAVAQLQREALAAGATPQRHAELAQTLAQAAALAPRQKSNESCDLLKEAVAHQKAVAEARPQDAGARGRLRTYNLAFADALVTAGRHAEAARQLDEATREAPADWPEWARAAALAARCAELAGKDDKLPVGERERLAEADGARAVALLRRAIQAGRKDPALLRSSDFDAVRGRADFAKLETELKPPGAR